MQDKEAMRLRVALQYSGWLPERGRAGIVLRYNSATIPIGRHLQMSAAPRAGSWGSRPRAALVTGAARRATGAPGPWSVFSPVDFAITRYPRLLREGLPMWILMYVFSYSVSPVATSDRAEWRLQPTVVFQEFTSEDRCRSAKSKLEESLKQAGVKLKSALGDLQAVGKIGPQEIIIAYDVDCLPK
jgi:hypothetical protein